MKQVAEIVIVFIGILWTGFAPARIVVELGWDHDPHVACPRWVAAYAVRSFTPGVALETIERPSPALEALRVKFVHEGFQRDFGWGEEIMRDLHAEDQRTSPHHRMTIEYRDPASNELLGLQRWVSTTRYSPDPEIRTLSRQQLPVFHTYRENPRMVEIERQHPLAVEVRRNWTSPTLSTLQRIQVLFLMYRAGLAMMREFRMENYVVLAEAMPHNSPLFEEAGLTRYGTDLNLYPGNTFLLRKASELIALVLTPFDASVKVNLPRIEADPHLADTRAAFPPRLLRSMEPISSFWLALQAGQTISPRLEAQAGSPFERSLILNMGLLDQISERFDLETGLGDADGVVRWLQSEELKKQYPPAVLNPQTEYDFLLFYAGLVHLISGNSQRAREVRHQLNLQHREKGFVSLGVRGRSKVLQTESRFASPQEQLLYLQNLKTIYPYWLLPEIHAKRASLLEQLGDSEQSRQAKEWERALSE